MNAQAMQQGSPDQLSVGSIQSPVIGGPQNATNDLMQAFAQNQLGLGGKLDPQTEQNIINATLSGFNTMGRAQDPMAVAQTALNLSDATQARQQQQFGYANTAAGIGQQTASTNASNSMQAQALNAANSLQAQSGNVSNQMQSDALKSQMLGGAYNAQMGTTIPALQMVLNPSAAIGQSSQAYATGAATPTSAQAYNPYGAGMQLYEDATSLEQNKATASANKSSALIGGGMSMAGSIGGAALLAL
jgi:hypothetical protein